MPATATCRRNRFSRPSTPRSASRRNCPARRAKDRQGRLPRAVPGPRDHGADGVHGARRRRSRRRVGRRAGSAQRTGDGGAGARPGRRTGACDQPAARRRVRPPAALLSRLRRPRRAHREGDVAGAGEGRVEPRERHPARLLSAGGAWRGLPAGSTATASRSASGRSTPAAATANRCSCPTRSTTRPRIATPPHPIPTGPWRSVLNSQHGFFKESFVDELAHAAGKDPFEFRRDLLTDQPRFRAVLERAAAHGRLGQPAAGRRRPRHRHRRELRQHRGPRRARRGLARGPAPRPQRLLGRGLRRRRSTPTPRRRRSRAASSSACQRRCSARSRSRTAASSSETSGITR